MASTSRYGGMMLSKLAATSSSRAPFMAAAPARAFSTSLALRDPRRTSRAADDAAAAAPAQPRVRHNPLVGNYAPPKPTKLSPDTPPPVSTEHPNSTKPPMSSAEVPPNADMPPVPPPPPPPKQAAGQSLRQALDPNYKPEYDYDALAEAADSKAAEAKAVEDAVDRPLSDYKRINIMDIISHKATGFSEKLRTFDPTTAPTIRTAAVVGRTIHVKRERAFGVNTALSAASAFRTLGKIIVQERVPFKAKQQKFHERPGLKRKRLSSERWKRRFRTGFTATVNRVMELKRQGW